MYSKFDYCCIIFEAVSTVLYVFLISRMIISGLPMFRTGFFLIFIACSCSDIGAGFVHGAMRHIVFNMEDSLKMGAKVLTLTGSTTLPEVFSWSINWNILTFSSIHKLLYYLSGQVVVSHVLLSLLLSANRCTAVGWPSGHSKFWSTRNTSIAIAVVYIISMLCNVEALSSRDTVIKDRNGNNIFIDMEQALQSRIYLTAALIFAIRSVLCLIMSIYTMRKLLQFAPEQDGSMTEAERKLCFHTLILFVGSWVMVAQEIVMFYASSTGDLALGLWIANQFPWISDIVMYTNVYSIIICSSHVRALFGIFRSQSGTEPSVSASAQTPVFSKRHDT